MNLVNFMKDIQTLRQNINEIDLQLIELLTKRKQVCLDIAEYKFHNGRAITDKTRERNHLDELMHIAQKQELSAELIRNIFTQIFEDSVALQNSYTYVLANINPKQIAHNVKVACLGPDGSYSYLATNKYFKSIKNKLNIQSCSSFNEIIEAVEQGSATFGVMPIENTSSGCINEVYDLLQDTKVKIVGELTYNIEHCILTFGNTNLNSIKTIYTHPQPATQCSIWLNEHLPNVTIKTTTASSAAIREVATLKDQSVAAIGSSETGSMFGLTAIASGIANQKHNVTRFIVISLSKITVSEATPAKTSITFTTENKPGSLAKVLDIFSRHNINIVKLQSRPRSPNAASDSIWAETFYADICINTASPLMQHILLDLDKVTGSVKVLGCYPSENVNI